MTMPEQTPDSSQPNEHMTKNKSSGKHTKQRNRKKFLFIILAIFAVFAVVGGFMWFISSGYEETDNATIEAHVSPVSARVAGTITQVLVDDNQFVKQGQLLAVIDPADYDVALKEAEARLQAAIIQADVAKQNIAFTAKQSTSQLTQAQGGIAASQSQIRQTLAVVNEAQAGIDSAKQNLNREEANYQKALMDYKRYQGVDPDAVSGQQLDTVRVALKSAEAARNSASQGVQQFQAKLSQARANVTGSNSRLLEAKGSYQGAEAQQLQIEIAKAQYEDAKAAAEQTKAALERAKLNVSYTKIYAPISGRIGRKSVETGQRVQANEPLMAIVQPDIWVVANFKEIQLSRMKIGQAVDIHIDAFPNHEFRGKVESFSPATGATFALLPPENATGNFTKIVQRVPVKILFTKASMKGYANRLSPGLSVVAKVEVR